MKRYYVGLASSFHDPAFAIVGPDGSVLFAEATERYLQYKQAPDCLPDLRHRSRRLVQEYCDPDAELVCVTSWSRAFLSRMSAASAAFAAAYPFERWLGALERKLRSIDWPLGDFRYLVRSQMHSNGMAGINVRAAWGWKRPVSMRRRDHHLCHAALAGYASGFDHAVVAVLDGNGETRSNSFYELSHGGLRLLPQQRAGDGLRTHHATGLGAFYSQVCTWCGFDPGLGEEWKVMGLAPYGKLDPELYDLMRPLLRVEGLRVRSGCSTSEYSRRLSGLKSRTRRKEEPPETSADLAHTGQHIFEELMTELLHNAQAAVGADRLALAGGCALNSSWNGRIVQATPFRSVFVPSAPGDDGNALGAALLAYHEDNPGAQPRSELLSPYLGSAIEPHDVQRVVDNAGLGSKLTQGLDRVLKRAAGLLAEGRILGWARGRAEFGPRALGNRSILADPRREEMKDRVNACVKHREAYRPFAPAVLDEHGHRYFKNYQVSPYMERTLEFLPEVRTSVAAVVHVNGTGRLQSVRRSWNPAFYDLIQHFFEQTGIPLVMNTSLNIMGKPIVHSVEDVLGMFYTTGLDALVLGDCLIEK